MAKPKKVKFSDLLNEPDLPMTPLNDLPEGDDTPDALTLFNHELTRTVEAAVEEAAKQGIEQDEPWQYDDYDPDDDGEEEEDVSESVKAAPPLNPPDYFRQDPKIPLIKFSQDSTETLGILNSLIQYSEEIIRKKDTSSFSFFEATLHLYINKIEEGIRFAKHIQGDSFFKSELLWIEGKVASIKEVVQNGKGKRSFWG